MNKLNVFLNGFVSKETEKAILFNCSVFYGMVNHKEHFQKKQIWIPKTALESISGDFVKQIEIKNWFFKNNYNLGDLGQ